MSTRGSTNAINCLSFPPNVTLAQALQYVFLVPSFQTLQYSLLAPSFQAPLRTFMELRTQSLLTARCL